MMAENLHRQTTTPNLSLLSSRNMQQRWENYVKKFKAVYKMSVKETGVGLTREELESGLSMPAKLGKLCSCFSRMRDLFGERPNVKPAAVLEMGPFMPVKVGESGEVLTANEHVQELADAFEGDYGDESERSGAEESADGANGDSSGEDEVTEQGEGGAGELGQDGAKIASEDVVDEVVHADADDEVRLLCVLSPSPPASPSHASSSSRHGSAGETSNPRNPETRTNEAAQRVASTQRKRSEAADADRSTKRAKTKKGKRPSSKSITSHVGSHKASGNENKPPPTAHETRMSLSQAYAKNSESRIGFLEAKLEETKRQWNESQTLLKQQKLAERDERRANRKQELMIELIRQQKTPEEIATFMSLLD